MYQTITLNEYIKFVESYLKTRVSDVRYSYKYEPMTDHDWKTYSFSAEVDGQNLNFFGWITNGEELKNKKSNGDFTNTINGFEINIDKSLKSEFEKALFKDKKQKEEIPSFSSWEEESPFPKQDRTELLARLRSIPVLEFSNFLKSLEYQASKKGTLSSAQLRVLENFEKQYSITAPLSSAQKSFLNKMTNGLPARELSEDEKNLVLNVYAKACSGRAWVDIERKKISELMKKHNLM